MASVLKVACLCGAIQDTVEVKSELPVQNITCSCNLCRWTTGVLYLSAVHIDYRPSFLDKLQVYRSSSRIERYFCPDCGTHVGLHGIEDKSWSICSGAVEGLVGLDGPIPRLEKHTQHEFVGDTIDGGLIVCLVEGEKQQVPIFLQGPDERPLNVAIGENTAAAIRRAYPTSNKPSETLTASCHCGGVEYFITRPNSQSSACSSPWPDLIKPYHSGSSANEEDTKWWLQASGTKYLAGTCACRSCRLACGVPIQTWAFVPKVNIRRKDGSPLEDFSLGTLKQYNSSAECYREFCGACGASVFWHCDWRADLIDVSVGLLRAPEGARCETWLKWWPDRLSFKEYALDAHLKDTFETGLKALADSDTDK
jgi:hypothetical protein